jgi:hypothetical protein
MQATVTLEEQQWQVVLNQLGEGSINRCLPLYMNIQQQLVRQQQQAQQQPAAEIVQRSNGEAHDALAA